MIGCEGCKELRKKIKDLKNEVSNLNGLLQDCDEASWDQEGLYEDARDGKWNGNDLGGSPDEDYSIWLAKRYNLKIDDEGEVVNE